MSVEIPNGPIEPIADPKPHWLTTPETIRKLWFIGLGILALTVIAEPFVHMHPHFGFDGWFAFNAWFGFLTCVGMVVFAKILGIFLKRKDTYYDH
ncbi:hypothetical protein [Rhodospirillum sp. A1_3_36]|uniref:hypothetical protein n=1 Tax=Rhodospirillum sp. A1_3_36 TaxID=3391666 RepID=UPI0039A62E4F